MLVQNHVLCRKFKFCIINFVIFAIITNSQNLFFANISSCTVSHCCDIEFSLGHEEIFKEYQSFLKSVASRDSLPSYIRAIKRLEPMLSFEEKLVRKSVSWSVWHYWWMILWNLVKTTYWKAIWRVYWDFIGSQRRFYSGWYSVSKSNCYFST